MKRMTSFLALLILSLAILAGPAAAEGLVREGRAIVPGIRASFESSTQWRTSSLTISNITDERVRLDVVFYDLNGDIIHQGPSGFTQPILKVFNESAYANTRYDLAETSVRFSVEPGETMVVELCSTDRGIENKWFYGWAEIKWWANYYNTLEFSGPALIADLSLQGPVESSGRGVGGGFVVNGGQPF